jgi:hypothetical protein
VNGFLHPAWLWALPAASLPLVLHLIARRQPPTVPFPAVRYLQQVTREHQRRLKLQHWLLLLVRTLLIVALVLAAAGPSVARKGLPGHAPAALVLILDNSPSSGAVSGGTPVLQPLREAARTVLDKATPDDAVWLLGADGIARRAPALELRAVVDSVEPSEFRLDLGDALRQADGILAEAGRPSEIVLLSDLQESALSAADTRAPVLVGMSERATPRNLGVVLLDPGPQPWSPGEGRVRVAVGGDSGASAPMVVQLGDRPGRPRLAGAGATIEVPLEAPAPGWWPVTAQLDPDEFRADDRRLSVVRVAPVARARWDPGDRYLDAAASTLRQGGRLRDGDEVSIGTLGDGPSVVLPPIDIAALGALNRRLERRGVPWRFGGPVTLEQVTDSGPLVGVVRVAQRFRLVYAGGAPRGVEATVAGEPWIVRAGTVVLVGSRFDPSWTALPISASFVPLLDALANRLVRGEEPLRSGAPGTPLPLPDAADAVTREAQRWPVEGGAPWRPPARGVYFVRRGADTIGAVAVNLDPRESILATATAARIHALWPRARLVPLARVREASFGAGARGELRGPLLWIALLLGLLELGLASLRRRAA